MTTAEQIAAVDAIFAEWDSTNSPGCAVGVIKDGEVVHSRGYGMASLELGVSISPSSVFHVASISKQFCAISVALLADEGKLSLDDDVHVHFPELPDFGHTITVRHLIHHTNGLRDQYGLFRLAGWRDGDAQLFDDVLNFAFRHRRLNFEPGSQYAYCNTSYTLLALIVKRVSGQSLREFTTGRIFEPLGMGSSFFLDERDEVVPQRTVAYATRNGGFKTLNSNVDAVGAICLYTCVEDLLRWQKNLRERAVAGNVLDAAMTSGVLNDGEQTCYGYGMMLDSYRGLTTVGHGGVDSGYRAHILWFPDADFGVVVLANLSSIKPGKLARQVADLCLGDSLGPGGISDEPEIELKANDLEPLTGIFIQKQTRQVRQVELHEDRLLMPTSFGDDLVLTPVAPDRFRADEPPIEIRFVTSDDEPLELHEIMSNGRVTIFTRIEQVEPSTEELAGYVGSYHCPEIGATHRLILRDGSLIMRQPRGDDHKLTPATTDEFVYPMTSLAFHRDARGDVSRVDLFNDRIRYLSFERL